MSNNAERLKHLTTVLHTILNSERDLFDDSRSLSKLYHYTTLDGAIGILQSKTIFASNAMFLNDSSELVYGKELIQSAINNVIDSDNFETTHYFGFGEQENEMLRLILSELNGVELKDIYISCFSTKSDMLSQWRGYADGGIRIGFDAVQLCNTFSDVSIADINYNRKSQLKFIETILIILLNYLYCEPDDIYLNFPLIPEGRDVLLKNKDIIPQAIASILIACVGSFKNQGFKEESEYRLIYDVNNIYNKESRLPVRYRSNGKFIVPYVNFEFGDKLPITDIMVGQSPYSDKIKQGLELLLKSEGYKEIKVKLSQIPYIP